MRSTVARSRTSRVGHTRGSGPGPVVGRVVAEDIIHNDRLRPPPLDEDISGPGPSRRPPRPSDDDRERWVGAWRSAVGYCVLPAGLIDLPGTRMLALSPAAEYLFGSPPAGGEPVGLAAVIREHVAAAAQALASDAVDACHAHRQVPGPGGMPIEVSLFCRAVRSRRGGDLGLWFAREGDHRPDYHDEASRDRAWRPSVASTLTMARLSPEWRVENIGPEIEDLLGFRSDDFVGTVLFDHVHPADLAHLVGALAAATCRGEKGVEIRVAHAKGGWQRVRAVVMCLAGNPQPRFGLSLEPVDDQMGNTADGRVRQLERHLVRIAEEIQVAGVLQPLGVKRTSHRLPHFAELSERQREILVRLASGDRVARIADELYLSESTVRNHLSAIFTRFGVHSQDQLLRIIAER